MPWIAGQQLQGGKYVIETVLGRGGFGITYKALHVELNQTVVIKTPNEYLSHDPEYEKYIERFTQEGRTLARLSEDPHPHIVGVIDLFEEGATHCLVMDFVEGENLFEAVRLKGALPEAEILPCIRQIGEALSVVHQAGLVHRDAHPGNIMVRKNGKAVLIDFGIAKQVVPSTISSTNKDGHEAFAPYEQKVRGSRKPTVDVYCLAATLYYAVTGKRPTTSLARKLDNASLTSPKQFNPKISDQLNKAILKGMALEAEDRPQSMQAWLAMLEVPKAMPLSPFDPVYRQGIVPSKAKPKATPDKLATKSPGINRYQPATKSPTIIRYQPTTKSDRIIPWVRLVGILFIYILLGYALALALHTAPLLQVVSIGTFVWVFVWVFVWTVAVAGTWTWAKVCVWVVAGAWAWVVASTGVGAWAWAWAWVLASTERKLEQSFNNFHTFLILIGTSGLGLGLGFLGHRIFNTGL
ncbi:serine/threonine protein kinase [Nostoc sp. UIC 10607]|uniref:serine/threonine protein kinase n=1 Tax=Nostoc sp. UIC 10607 TaxID=3045935 RepID=UPI0039A082AB